MNNASWFHSVNLYFPRASRQRYHDIIGYADGHRCAVIHEDRPLTLPGIVIDTGHLGVSNIVAGGPVFGDDEHGIGLPIAGWIVNIGLVAAHIRNRRLVGEHGCARVDSRTRKSQGGSLHDHATCSTNTELVWSRRTERGSAAIVRPDKVTIIICFRMITRRETHVAVCIIAEPSRDCRIVSRGKVIHTAEDARARAGGIVVTTAYGRID